MSQYLVVFKKDYDLCLFPFGCFFPKRKIYLFSHNFSTALTAAKFIAKGEEKIVSIKRVDKLPKRAYVLAMESDVVVTVKDKNA